MLAASRGKPMFQDIHAAYMPPFQIIGNLYFVGTKPASVHLIDTGEGLVLLDSGYDALLELVLENIHALGFHEKQIRYILHSHGHIDHIGGTRALVELTGSLAGFTFAMQNTKLIALSGLIIGISATFSMASSEFLSARSEGRTDALKSCTYTGIAYLITVVLLILPYLLLGTTQYIAALVCMLLTVILIIAGFTYYTSVAQGREFKSRFLEMAGISISVAVISFVVGVLAKQLLGVDL